MKKLEINKRKVFIGLFAASILIQFSWLWLDVTLAPFVMGFLGKAPYDPLLLRPFHENMYISYIIMQSAVALAFVFITYDVPGACILITCGMLNLGSGMWDLTYMYVKHEYYETFSWLWYCKYTGPVIPQAVWTIVLIALWFEALILVPYILHFSLKRWKQKKTEPSLKVRKSK